MKSVKKSRKLEPTITNVMVAVQDLTEAVQVGFAKNDTQHDEIRDSLNDLGYRVTAVEKRTGSLENAIDDMKETLEGVAKAVDKDSLAILDHERRVRHLEKTND